MIEHRLGEDQPALRRRERAFALHEQLLPGKPGRLAVERPFGRLGDRAHRPVDLVERRCLCLDAVEHRRERGIDAAQRRVGGERPEHRLRLDQRSGGLAHIFGRAEQQPLAGEEIAAIGAAHEPEMGRVCRQLRRELRRAALGKLGRRAIDHHQHHIAELREGGFHCPLLLAPVDIGRDQRRCVGRHVEARRAEDERQRRERQAHAERHPGPADTGGNDVWNGRSHAVVQRDAGPEAPMK